PTGFIPIGPTLKLRSREGLAVDDVKFTFVFGELFAMPGLSGLYIEVSNCESEGIVRAVSRDPRAEPHIEHRFFSDPRDLDRLLGAENLYIADASVMPTVPRANINLPTMMIGERVADFVRTEL